MRNIRTPEGGEKPWKRALKEWEALAAPLASLGFKLHAFDPGVSFICPETKLSISFPVATLKLINKGTK